MKRFLSLCLLLLLLATACQPKRAGLLNGEYRPTATPTPIPRVGKGGPYAGVYKQIGSLMYVEVGGGQAQLFYATVKTCTIQDRPFPIVGTHLGSESGPNVEMAGDKMVVTMFGGEKLEFVKVSGLPAPCATAETDAKDPKYVFDAFWNTLNEVYPFFKIRGVDWQKVYDRNVGMVKPTMSISALRNMFTEMIKELKDCTTSVGDMYGSSPFPDYDVGPDWKIMRAGLTITTEKNYLKDSHWTDSGRLLYGKLNDKVGYLYVKSFAIRDENGDAAMLKEYDDVVKYFRGMIAVVIDMRAVHYATSVYYAMKLAGHFTDQPVKAFTTQVIDSGELTPPVEKVVEPSEGSVFKGKVVVLTGPAIYGGAEQFVLAMQAMPNITLVGERTAGCPSDITGMPLPGNTGIIFPYQMVTANNGEQYEAKGIPPDVAVRLKYDDWLRGKDPVIERAVEVALEP